MERLRAVPGYEGLYEVSDLGRVRSLDRVRMTIRWGKLSPHRIHGRIMKQMFHPYSGYLCVGTRGPNGDKSKDYIMVHRAVLEAFVGPAEGRWGLHWTDNFLDNHLENLRWGSPSENAFDRERNKRERSQDG